MRKSFFSCNNILYCSFKKSTFLYWPVLYWPVLYWPVLYWPGKIVFCLKKAPAVNNLVLNKLKRFLSITIAGVHC